MRLKRYASYEEYASIQSQWSVRKRSYVWAQADVLIAVANHIKALNIHAPFGICHGVRNGFEVSFLHDALKEIDATVIGTEISEVAKESPFTIQWDFHKVKPEWIGKVDFIYSNSFDHSYDPETCLKNWMSCISPKGMCFLEWTNTHNADGVGEADCFRAALDEYISLAEGFHVQDEIIHGQRNKINGTKSTHIIMISHPDRKTI